MQREFTAHVFGQAFPGDAAAAAALAVCFSACQLVITAAHGSGALKVWPEEPHTSSGIGGSSCLRSSAGKQVRHHGDGEVMSENKNGYVTSLSFPSHLLELVDLTFGVAFLC